MQCSQTIRISEGKDFELRLSREECCEVSKSDAYVIPKPERKRDGDRYICRGKKGGGGSEAQTKQSRDQQLQMGACLSALR